MTARARKWIVSVREQGQRSLLVQLHEAVQKCMAMNEGGLCTKILGNSVFVFVFEQTQWKWNQPFPVRHASEERA